MRLSQVERCLITVALKSPPFKAGKLADEVGKILEIGNSKHGDGRVSANEHLKHATAHLRQTGNDVESGLTHFAHGVARLVLALIVLCNEQRTQRCSGETGPEGITRPAGESAHRGA